jgi:hypothetical protein
MHLSANRESELQVNRILCRSWAGQSSDGHFGCGAAGRSSLIAALYTP